jgi:hypothetical protein
VTVTGPTPSQAAFSHAAWSFAGERGRKVAAAGDTELAECAREVYLDRLRRHEERLGDLAVGGSERGQLTARPVSVGLRVLR